AGAPADPARGALGDAVLPLPAGVRGDGTRPAGARHVVVSLSAPRGAGGVGRPDDGTCARPFAGHGARARSRRGHRGELRDLPFVDAPRAAPRRGDAAERIIRGGGGMPAIPRLDLVLAALLVLLAPVAIVLGRRGGRFRGLTGWLWAWTQ